MKKRSKGHTQVFGVAFHCCPASQGRSAGVDKARASCHSTQRRRPRGALPRLSHLCRPVFLFRDSLSSVSSVTCSKEELCDA